MVNSFNYYYYAAAATAIAGILHIVLSANGIGRGSLSSIFFLIAGIAQLFWALPMARRWGRIWYYIGIGGTIVLIILYFVTRVPTPITEGRALRINSMGIVIEIFQFLYIGLTAYILTRQGSSTHNIQNSKTTKTHNK
jgi:uncharacterized membrane protein